MLKRLDKERSFGAYAEHFGQAAVLDAITQAAKDAAAWMRANKGSVDEYGTPIERPWFDEGANASPLPFKMAERARHHTLDARAYEHGLAKYLEFAATLEALPDHVDNDLTSLVMLRSAETEGWFHILNRYSWVEKSMNLDHFAETGDSHPDTPSSHSKTKLLKLASFGFTIVQKPQKAFDIKVGPLAKAFYDDVWYPITDEFKTKIAVWKEEGK